jgi:RNA polymerase sigma-70 factor (ECF subfamily)
MSETSLHTKDLRLLIERSRKGDREAQNVLLRRAGQRLEHIARAMLHRFPAVATQVETADVLQNALIRLLNALKKIDPPTTRDFFGLAALQIRRELIDLGKYFKRRGAPANAGCRRGDTAVPFDPEDKVGEEEGDLDLWCALHEAVERLPAAEREVFSLSFYHGWTQAQIAELLHVTGRQVRRRWNAALLALSEDLGGSLPDLQSSGVVSV